MTVKQVIIIRKDLGMRRGKEIAQGSHASMAWLVDRAKDTYVSWPENTLSFSNAEADWLFGDYRKVVCQVQSLEELETLYKKAQEAGLESHLVTDLGYTEFGGTPTVTALAIGPDEASKIDALTGGLKLY